MRKIKVFISYSHRDEAFKEALDRHLSSLKRSHTITTWNDRAILAGEAWDEAIKTELEQAEIILLLVSASFLASNYIWEEELTRAMTRHHAKAATVVPVFILDCDWKGAPFGGIQGLPRDAEPVGKVENDPAWTEIAKGIRALVEQWSARSAVSVVNGTALQAITTQHILDWPTAGVLRPGCTRTVLNELLIRRQSINLTGPQGHGKSRLLHDLKALLTQQEIPAALLNLKEHRLQYANFLRSLSMQLGLARNYEHFEDLVSDLSLRRGQRFVLLIDNLETLNEYRSNDPRYNARFVSSLNLLKDLPHTHLLCSSREWLKAVVFDGETSLLNLHRVGITPLAEQEIQAELRQRLDSNPLLQEAAQLQAARAAVQAAAQPHTLLEELIRRVLAQEPFDQLLNNLRHG